jgi:hypothetical protein
MKPTGDYCRSRASCLKCCVACCMMFASRFVFRGVECVSHWRRTGQIDSAECLTCDEICRTRDQSRLHHSRRISPPLHNRNHPSWFRSFFTCPSRYSLTIERIENKHESDTKKSDKKGASQQVMDSSPQQGRKRKADDHDSASKSLKRSAVFSDSQVGNLSVTTASSSIS